MSDAKIHPTGTGTFIAAITGEGWSCSAEFGSYIAASDFLAENGFGYGIVERKPVDDCKPESPVLARMMRENRAVGI